MEREKFEILAFHCLDEIEDILKRYISAGAGRIIIKKHLKGLTNRLWEKQFTEPPDPLKALIYRPA